MDLGQPKWSVEVRLLGERRPTQEDLRQLGEALDITAGALWQAALRDWYEVDRGLSQADAQLLAARLEAMGWAARAQLAHSGAADPWSGVVDAGIEKQRVAAVADPLVPLQGDSHASTNAWNVLFPELDGAPADKPHAHEVVEAAQTPALAPASASVSESTASPAPPLGPAPVLGEGRVEEGPERVAAFDGIAVQQLARARTGRPPYAPLGFDDRPEHLPALAGLLGTLAPGAGQVYNGQEEEAIAVALHAWKARPWVEGARQARRHAEVIASDYAPRPASGALGRALRHVALWWVVMACMAGIASAVVPVLAERVRSSRVAQPDGAAGVEDALALAGERVLFARVRALSAVEELKAERAARRQEFTMSDEERAERLFRVGYAECTRRQYDVCEAAMKRVTSLRPGHRQAFRLQVWASAQRYATSPVPMPDVGPVQTLSAFEMQMLAHEDVTTVARLGADLEAQETAPADLSPDAGHDGGPP